MSVKEFAARSLITRWIQLAGTIGMSWAPASGIVAARMLGQGRSEASLDAFLSRARHASFLAAASVALVYAAVCLSAPRIHPDLDAQTHAIVSGFLVVLVPLPFPKQSNATCGNALRAGGETVPVMHIFVWSRWGFRIPATVILAWGLDAPAWAVLSPLPGEAGTLNVGEAGTVEAGGETHRFGRGDLLYLGMGSGASPPGDGDGRRTSRKPPSSSPPPRATTSTARG